MIWTFYSHLRCDVVRGAAEGARAHAFIHVLLTHAKVGNLDVALGVQHHVVELQIPAAERGCERLCTCTFLDLWQPWFCVGLHRCISSEQFICPQCTSNAGKQTISSGPGIFFPPFCLLLLQFSLSLPVYVSILHFLPLIQHFWQLYLSQSSVRMPNTWLVEYGEWMWVLSWSTEEEQGDLTFCQAFLSVLSIFTFFFASGWLVWI